MIKTLAMALRETDALTTGTTIPHINSSNALVGTCNPLKLFLCPYGLSNVGTINARLNNAVGVTSIFIGSDATLTSNMIVPSTGYKAADGAMTELNIGATDDVLIVAAGQQSSANSFRFDIADTADGATSIALLALRNNVAGTGQCIITDDASAHTVSLTALSAATAATDQIYAVAFDRSANGKAHRDSGTVASIATQTTSIATVTGALTFASAAPSIFMFGKYYAVAMFKFTAGTLPSDWEAQVSWMGANWILGNYVVPPAWKNL